MAAEATDTHEFALRVVGEWEGRQTVYDGRGENLPLPDVLVPDDFLQYGVKMYDLTTQSSMTVLNGDTLRYKYVRQVAQAGCHGEVTNIESQDQAGEFAFNSDDFWCWADGSYVRANVANIVNPIRRTIGGPFKVEDDDFVATEVCLTKEKYDPSAPSWSETGHRQRVRVWHVTHKSEPLRTAYVIYVLESWASEYNNLQSLAVCYSLAAVPTFDNKRASTDWDTALAGTWLRAGDAGEVTIVRPRGAPQPHGFFGLPFGVSLEVSSDGLVLGWLTGPDTRRVVSVAHGTVPQRLTEIRLSENGAAAPQQQ